MKKFINLKDKWLRFGCFLSGYNYEILNECSEVSKREVKKITSALIIILLIWTVIGYIFTLKYLGGGIYSSILGSIFLGIIIIQIERQIILSNSVGKAKYFRIVLGIIIAFIGATIIDQYVFKNDIDVLLFQNSGTKTEEYNQTLTKSYDSQFAILEQSIKNNDSINNRLRLEINTLPAVVIGNTGRDYDTTGKTTSTEIGYIPNPIVETKNGQINKNQEEITKSQNQIRELKSELLEKLEKKRKELNSLDKGFLEELNALFSYLTDFKKNGYLGLIFYGFWFLFFLMIELLVLNIKLSSNDSKKIDYEIMIQKHSDIRTKSLENL